MCENNDEFFVCSASQFAKESLMLRLISFVVCYLDSAGNLPGSAGVESFSLSHGRRYKKTF